MVIFLLIVIVIALVFGGDTVKAIAIALGLCSIVIFILAQMTGLHGLLIPGLIMMFGCGSAFFYITEFKHVTNVYITGVLSIITFIGLGLTVIGLLFK